MLTEFDLRRQLGDIAYYSVVARDKVIWTIAQELNRRGHHRDSENIAPSTTEAVKFAYLAKTGFLLAFRNDEHAAGLLLERVLTETDMRDELAVLNTVEAILNPDRIIDPNAEPFLPLFGHSVATLIFLTGKRKVSLKGIGYYQSSDAINLGNYGNSVSNWDRDLTLETIWTELDNVNQALITTHRGNMPKPLDLIRSAHFLAAATHLARKINRGYLH